jgi:hypothetical protein
VVGHASGASTSEAGGLTPQTLHMAQNHVDTMPDKDVALLARKFLQVRHVAA